jgi:hypothetical protein
LKGEAMKTTQKAATQTIDQLASDTVPKIQKFWHAGDLAQVKAFLEESKRELAYIEAEIKRQLYDILGK